MPPLFFPLPHIMIRRKNLAGGKANEKISDKRRIQPDAGRRLQYAPELFSYIKMAIDKGAAPGSFWLTGSQPFKLMELTRETLAGRIAIIHMPSLSQHEIYGNDETEPFSIDLEKLKKRSKINKPADIKEKYRRIWSGS